ncbi:hypothetical protein Tco_1285005 [Tanacetum coccineum]
MATEVPQTLEYRGGQLNAAPLLEVESFINWKKRYKALMNELVNDGIKLSKLEINISFINGLPKKWLSFIQSLRNTNHVKEPELASLFGKLKYKENLIDSIYDNENKKALTTVTPLSTAFISTSIVQIIMLNVIPPDHVDDVSIVEPNQHNDDLVVPEPVLVDDVTPRQGGNARRDEKGNPHNTLTSM